MTYEEMLVEFQLFSEEQADNMSIEAFKTIDLLLSAIKKQIPKKIVKGKDLFWEYQCPNTNCDTQFARHASYAFCPGCGQALDWSVNE